MSYEVWVLAVLVYLIAVFGTRQWGADWFWQICGLNAVLFASVIGNDLLAIPAVICAGFCVWMRTKPLRVVEEL